MSVAPHQEVNGFIITFLIFNYKVNLPTSSDHLVTASREEALIRSQVNQDTKGLKPSSCFGPTGNIFMVKYFLLVT